MTGVAPENLRCAPDGHRYDLGGKVGVNGGTRLSIYMSLTGGAAWRATPRSEKEVASACQRDQRIS
jgi:hypothetical protein